MSGTNANSIARVYDALQGRNRIINGSCNIAQRGSVAVTASTNTYGGPDRYASANNSTGQFTQSQGTITFGGIARNAVVQTVNTTVGSIATTNYWIGIQQIIEGYNAFDLLGQTASVSFIFNTNVSGTYSVALRDGPSSNTYMTTFTATANTPTRYTFSIATLPTTLSIANSTAGGMSICIGALNTGTYTTSTLNAWQSGNFIAASGTTNWGTVAANFIAVAELQIEQGSIATPFERESIQTTLAKCQRYFWTTGTSVGQPLGVGQAFNTNSGSLTLGLPVQMRVTPTATASNLYALNASNTTLFVIGSFTISGGLANQVYFQLNSITSSPLVAGNAVLTVVGNSTGPVNGSLSLSAEY